MQIGGGRCRNNPNQSNAAPSIFLEMKRCRILYPDEVECAQVPAGPLNEMPSIERGFLLIVAGLTGQIGNIAAYAAADDFNAAFPEAA